MFDSLNIGGRIRLGEYDSREDSNGKQARHDGRERICCRQGTEGPPVTERTKRRAKHRVLYAKFDVHNPPLNLALNEAPITGRSALAHLGIQVASTDNVLGMKQKGGDAGLFSRDERQTNCCYAIHDKTWVRDPDGTDWEVFVLLK